MDAGDVIALVSALVAAAGLALAIYQRWKLDRVRLALDMLSEWNSKCADDRMKIERAFPGIYEECEPLAEKEAAALVKGRVEPGDSRKEAGSGSSIAEGRAVRDAAIRLLNHFEGVSWAALTGAAHRGIMTESCAGTMTRFYCLLGAFVAVERKRTGRNPWKPYTQFVYEATKRGRNGLEAGTCLCLAPRGYVCKGRANECPRREREVLAPLPDGA